MQARKKAYKSKGQQLTLQSLGWGGVRQGAGRPKLKRTKVGHKKRPVVKKLTPVHVTMRLKKDLPSLRTKRGFRAFKQAVIGARRKGLRVIQFALLGNHFHALLEVKDNYELSQAMRSLNGRLTRIINKWISWRRAGVFTERYHLELLRTPTQVRRTMLYIFSNAAKHFKRRRVFDLFCSYVVFKKTIRPERNSALSKKDWGKLKLTETQKAVYLELLTLPQSWLSRQGWQNVA